MRHDLTLPFAISIAAILYILFLIKARREILEMKIALRVIIFMILPCIVVGIVFSTILTG